MVYGTINSIHLIINIRFFATPQTPLPHFEVSARRTKPDGPNIDNIDIPYQYLMI